MKWVMAVVWMGFGCGAASADNCYVFQHGSDAWATCKEQAAEFEAARDRSRAEWQRVGQETRDSQAMAQQQQQVLMLEALLAKQKRD